MRGKIEALLMRAWMHRGLFAILMWPLSKLVKLIHDFRFALIVLGYKSQTKMAVPVIVVGNIFVGGTGKTPLVIWLVQQLQQAGWHPGVISRGYGAQIEQVREVFADSLASNMGDEPVLIAQKTRCPVMVGRFRVATAQALCAKYPQVDVIISDDGLQHYALARDVEIVMFDQRGIGNGWILPAGPLRETPKRKRDFTILNAPSEMVVEDIGENVLHMHLIADQCWQLSAPECQRDVRSFQGQKILATAGIGSPQRFFAMLKTHNITFAEQALNDHHQFTEESFSHIEADIILITEKDAVKCRQLTMLSQDARIWVVPVCSHLDDGDDFVQNVIKKIMKNSE